MGVGLGEGEVPGGGWEWEAAPSCRGCAACAPGGQEKKQLSFPETRKNFGSHLPAKNVQLAVLEARRMSSSRPCSPGRGAARNPGIQEGVQLATLVVSRKCSPVPASARQYPKTLWKLRGSLAPPSGLVEQGELAGVGRL